MRRCLLLLPLILGATACAGAKAKPTATKPDYEAVKARAEKSLNEVEPGLGEAKKAKTAPAPAAVAAVPESPAPSSQIGEKDPKLGCTWVRAEAKVTVNEDQSRSQVRAAAMEKARNAAMHDLLGVDVNSRSLDFQQEGLRGQTNLIESILRTTRRGRIINEKVALDQYCDLGDCRQCGYAVALRACIKDRPADADQDFQVGLSLSQDHFVESDRAVITVTSTRDAYLYLYDVGMNSETSLLVPNEFVPEARIRAGQTWTYPDEQTVNRGVYVAAQLPEGRPPVSAEVIRLVATKVPLQASYYDPARGGYLGVMQKLNASAFDWAEDASAFTIYPAKGK
ncbi:MAG: DUF4384 domain-containing protein [Elusimicrobia bacterium]|nr:DUF4384 domain-containing protein [Elusimicrobiota bacterium]